MEGVSAEAVFLALHAVWTPALRAGKLTSSHFCPPVWRGELLLAALALIPPLAAHATETMPSCDRDLPQVLLEWSKERYEAQFSIYADNIAGISYEQA